MVRPTAHARVGQAIVVPRFHDNMASQPQLCSAPVYAFVRDYECDSNPAYGVVESSNQTSTKPEHESTESTSGARADPSLTTAADTVTVRCDCMHNWYDLCMAYDNIIILIFL